MKFVLTFIALCIGLTGMLAGQSFGQNKVQYQDFDWEYIQSPHFDIYFYAGGENLAKFTSEIAEQSYDQISKHLRWDIKKPVSIIVYNSHNEFQQTNVVSEYMPEGVGGVTEMFKNRVVIPFEGSYEQFRHVIHHELVHAVINDMVYGGNVQSIISGRVRLQIPTWVNEGLAEFLSMNWDTQADLILRDIAIHEHMPDIQNLYGFLAYKGGQSVWRFITSKYGREKVGEILIAMKQTQNAEKGFERALGMNYKELSEQWHDYLKKEYWPDIAGRDALKDFAGALTDHKKRHNYYNISPSISPDGSKIAILSDRSGYADIYLIDAVTGKEIRRLVKGNRSIDFEELKWLQPGISWSPDSKSIIIAAKAGSEDVFQKIDVETGKAAKIEIPMDGLFSATYSPDGTQLAFVGNKAGASDIYLYDFATKNVTNLTHDLHSDSDPVWSPNGRRIVFVSDRGSHTSPDDSTNTDILSLTFDQTDLYQYDLDTETISRITDTDYNENYPVWIHGSQSLFCTADYNGVWNIFKIDLNTGKSYPVTNVLTGIQQLSLSSSNDMLVFAGYNDFGWDIYSISDPLRMPPVKVAPSQFILKGGKQSEDITDLRQQKRKLYEDFDIDNGDYTSYIFAPEYEDYNKAILTNNTPESELDSDSTRKAHSYIPHPYKTHFSLDMVSGNLTISNVFGTQGMTYFSWSDVLGDHQFTLGTEMVLTLENSDYYFAYGYLKNRTDLYFSAYQTANFYSLGLGVLSRLRHYGAAMYLSRPFNKFSRLDYGLSYHIIDYHIYQQRPYSSQFDVIYHEKLSALLPGVSWVMDNTAWGMTGPVDGYRHNISLTGSPGFGNAPLTFETLQFDFRKYFRFKRDYSLATRFMFGKSFGPQAQKFFLGGVPYWLFGLGETGGHPDQGQFRQGDALLDPDNSSLLRDVYFTEYAMPVRGSRYAERTGTNVVLANFEVRFPFINYLSLGFPLKMILGNIRGHAFLDVGAAWDNPDEFKSSSLITAKYGSTIPAGSSPWIAGFGVGTKINLGYFLLRIDTAWDINPNHKYSKPQYYFSLGPDW